MGVALGLLWILSEMSHPLDQAPAEVAVLREMALVEVVFGFFGDDDDVLDFVAFMLHELSPPGSQKVRSGCR